MPFPNESALIERSPKRINWNIHASTFRPSYMDSDFDTERVGSSEDSDETIYVVRDVVPPLTGAEYGLFKLAQNTERTLHPFSRFYREEETVDIETVSFLRSLVGAYTHKHSIDFIAMSRVWMYRDPPTKHLPKAPDSEKAVFELDDVTGTHALYRVLTTKADKYILIACHLNVHGLHRGDLRFIEVNGLTKTDGSPFSCLGHLVVGDIVGVTELAKTSHMPRTLKEVPVESVTQETPCFWMARSLVLMRRKRFSGTPFSFIQNGTAISPDFGRALTVQQKDGFVLAEAENKMFVGSGIIPHLNRSEFAGELHLAEWSELKRLTVTVAEYPDAAGVVTEYKLDEKFTRQLAIGTNAFRFVEDDSEDIVELSVLMGQSAVHVILSDGFDRRSFQMMNPMKEGALVKFSIPNTVSNMTEVLWRKQTKILIGGSQKIANAVIETTVRDENRLKITAQLSEADLDFKFGDSIHIVQQKINHSRRQLERGFFKNMPIDSNGRIIIETLYGGPPMNEDLYEKPKEYIFASSEPFKLNEDQNEYICRVLSGTPLTVATSPFGCGKSVTIATTAIFSVLETRKTGIIWQNLLVTQSHYASVNLVEIITKFKFPEYAPRIIRFIGEDDWKELPEACTTTYDLPYQLMIHCTQFVTGVLPVGRFEDLAQMVLFLTDRDLIDIYEMTPEAQVIYHSNRYTIRYSFSKFVHMFFKIIGPEIIIATADTLPDLLHVLQDVTTVQIDEASQVPESTLVTLFSRLPHACFGLVGDIRQLTPFCNDGLHGHLKRYGIGNTMERVLANNLFPKAVLKYVYRCHPVTTEMLGRMFYDHRLISGVTADDRNVFMRSRPDIWTNYHFPIMVLNNESPAVQIGTSLANYKEIVIVKSLVSRLMNYSRGFALKPTEIGVISFYKAQESFLTENLRAERIKCGTVDSFQGSEREVMIVCCTSEGVSTFVANKNRINVAMSRAKQATIVIGNARGLIGDPHWRDIVEAARANGCYSDLMQ